MIPSFSLRLENPLIDVTIVPVDKFYTRLVLAHASEYRFISPASEDCVGRLSRTRGPITRNQETTSQNRTALGLGRLCALAILRLRRFLLAFLNYFCVFNCAPGIWGRGILRFHVEILLWRIYFPMKMCCEGGMF